MQSLKRDAIEAISKLPDEATIDEIMYRLYVIEKVRNGREAVERGEVMGLDELKKEIRSW